MPAVAKPASVAGCTTHSGITRHVAYRRSGRCHHPGTGCLFWKRVVRPGVHHRARENRPGPGRRCCIQPLADRPARCRSRRRRSTRSRMPDYLPAFEEGMRQHLADIHKIADNPEAPTFDNTIEAMERGGETLTRVSRIFFGLVQADTSDARQKIQEEIAPKLAAHQDQINLESQTLRTRQNHLRPARHAESGPGAEASGRARLRRAGTCLRAVVRCRQGQPAQAQRGRNHALHAVPYPSGRRLGRWCGGGGRQGQARWLERRRHRRRGRCSQGAQARWQISAQLAEHHPAAGAGVAEESRTARRGVEGL